MNQRTLTIVSAGTLLVLINYAAPASVLPSVAADLGAGPTAQAWLINGIVLGLAALVLTAGSAADNHGRRRVFAAGAVVLALGTAASAVAPNPVTFALARVVQGGASAALLAAGLGLIGYAFPSGPARVRATATWGAMLGAGIAIGPLLAAETDRLTGWRSLYWGIAAFAVLLAVVARAALPESRAAEPRPLDAAGAALLGGGLTLLLTGVTAGREGWVRPGTLAPLAAGALLVAAFVAVQHRGHAPMLDLALFRNPAFVTATVGALVTGAAVVGPMTFLAAALQHDAGLSAPATAGLFAVWAGTSAAVSLLARRLSVTVDGRRELVVGLGVTVVGNLAMYAAVGPLEGGAWGLLLPGLVVAGVGSGVLNATLARIAVQSVPVDRAGMGSGANNTARYIGSSLGLAVVVATGGHIQVVLLLGAAVALTGALLGLRPTRPLTPSLMIKASLK
ncbi:MFS transporter [Actinomycetes bacterium KLBMP 9797]